MNWLYRFFYGRNGIDPLNVALIVVSMVLTLMSSIFNLVVLSILSWLLLILAFFRMMSKNLVKRREENSKFIAFWSGIKKKLGFNKARFNDRKTHRHFKCKGCGSELRVPKGKGVIIITCPVCKLETKAKT